MQQTYSEWDVRFLRLAREVSTWSKDPSTRTGAVIVRPDRSVASLGFNGFPRGMSDDPRWLSNRDEKYDRIVHCEMNALMFCGDRVPLEGYTLYTYPFASCSRCMVHMLQAGIRRFVTARPSEDALSRWADSFERTAKYAAECGAEILFASLGES